MEHPELPMPPASDLAAVDPVCGMSVNADAARSKGLSSVYQGVEYVFCGRGCKLEFDDDPATYLAPGYTPSM